MAISHKPTGHHEPGTGRYHTYEIVICCHSSHPSDPLHLILGARYTNWRVDTLTYSMEKNHTTPYAGLVFDIDDNWSTYASYTSIFQPQNDRDSSADSVR